MAWSFDPNIYFQQKPFDPFQSIIQGLATGQQLKEQQQRMGLARLESQQAGRRLDLTERGLGLDEQKFGLEQQLMPLRIQKENLEMQGAGLGLETSRLKLGEAQKALEKQKQLEDFGAKFARGEIGKNEFNARYLELYPEQIPINLEKQQKMEMENAKLEQEQKQWNLEFQRKLNADLNEKSWKEFQKEYQIKEPYLKFGIEQEQLNSSLHKVLRNKKIPDQTLTPKMAETASGMMASTATLFEYVDRIDNLVEKYGTEKMPSKAKAQMESEMRQLQGLLKSEDFVNLGVLTGPDLGFLEDMTGDPTKITSFSGENIRSRIKSVKETSKTKFNNKIQSLGFEPFKYEDFDPLRPKKEDVTKVGNYTVRPK